ncbi:MAG: sugar phosphate isomerase/epimerase family protein [Victivallales bacterium]
MIKFAVMTFMYDGWIKRGGSHEELIRVLSKSGVEGIEAFCNLFMDDDGLIKLYRKQMADASLAMPVMDLISNLACREKSQRDEAYEKMRKGIDVCDAMGSEIVHVAGCAPVEGVSPADGRKLIAEGLMEFVDDVEKRGMTLAFEDFNPSPGLICSAADCLDILKLTGGRVKFVFDTGNFEAVGEHAEDNFAKLIAHTCHFHFKDFKPIDDIKVQRGAHFGQGVIKNREVAGMIKNSGYSGWVALESYLQGDNGPVETVQPELELLKSWF